MAFVKQDGKSLSQGLIVVARSPSEEGGAAAFEAALVEALTAAGRPLVVVPHLYYLRRGMAAAERLAATTGPLVVASWLKPRAARWVLAALGRAEAGVTAVDLNEFGTGEEAAGKIMTILEAGSLNPSPGPSGHPLPRERGEEETPTLERRWYPVIDYSRCVGCKQCHDFCLFGVYEVDAAGRVEVRQPDNCKPGCPACARVCPTSAIIFPECKDDEAIAGGEGTVALRPRAGEQENSRAVETSTTTTPSTAQPRDDLDDLLDSLDALDKS